MFFWYGCFYLWWIFYYMISNCWFLQARLLILLWWSEIAEVIYTFEYFLCLFPQIFNSRINSYIIFCSSLFLSLIHLALLYITLYWLCVLVQIFSTFKSVEHLWKILIGGELLYSVLVSVVQQYEAALSIHIFPSMSIPQATPISVLQVIMEQQSELRLL